MDLRSHMDILLGCLEQMTVWGFTGPWNHGVVNTVSSAQCHPERSEAIFNIYSISLNICIFALEILLKWIFICFASSVRDVRLCLTITIF